MPTVDEMLDQIEAKNQKINLDAILDEIDRRPAFNAIPEAVPVTFSQVPSFTVPMSSARLGKTVVTDEAVPVQHEDGSTTYEVKPLGNRLDREGLFAPLAPTADVIKDLGLEAAPNESGLPSFLRGLGRGAVTVANSLTSPVALPFLASGAAEAGAVKSLASGVPISSAEPILESGVPVFNRAAAAGFGGQMASSVPEQAKELIGAQTPGEIAERAIGLGAAGIFGLGGLAAAGLPLTARVLSKTRTEPTNVEAAPNLETTFVPKETAAPVVSEAVAPEAPKEEVVNEPAIPVVEQERNPRIAETPQETIQAQTEKVTPQPIIENAATQEANQENNPLPEIQAEEGDSLPSEIPQESLVKARQIRDEIAQPWQEHTLEEASPGSDTTEWIDSKKQILDSIVLPDGWTRDENTNLHTKFGSSYLSVKDPVGDVHKIRIGDHPKSPSRMAENEIAIDVPKPNTLKSWAKAADNAEIWLHEKDQEWFQNPVQQVEQPSVTSPELAQAPAIPEPVNLGPGAANIAEFPEPSITSVKNAMVDKERVERGLTPMMAPMKRAHGQVWDEAMRALDRDDGRGRRLVDELKENPRSISDLEVAILDHERIERNNEYQNALDAVNNASDGIEREQAKTRLQSALKLVSDVDEAGKTSGTETARGLAARRMIVKDDYSLGTMLKRVQAEVNQGEPLTDKQLSEVKQAHDKIAALETQLEELQTKSSDEQVKQYFDFLLKDIKKSSKVSIKKGNTVTEFLDEQAEKAKQRIKERRNEGRLNIGLDPTELADHAIIGANYIAKGVTNLAQFTARLVQDFGEWIRPHANAIFSRAQQYYDSISEIHSIPSSKPPTPKEVIRSAEIGPSLDHKLVFNLARAYIQEGMDSLDSVMQAVTKDLSEFYPDLTERQVRDAFSGYGKIQFPSKEEDMMRLREFRRLAQLVSAIEDAEKKISPKKTGMQRDKPTQAIREKMKELTRVMRDNDIDPLSPELQLKSTLDGIKTRLRNQIEDLEKQLETGEKSPKRKGVSYDEEAQQLRERRDALKSRLEEIDGPSEITDEQRIQRATDAVNRSIEDLDNRIQNEIFVKPRGKQAPSTPELEKLRAERQAMRDYLKDLADAQNPKISPEERRLKIYKKAIQRRISELQKKIGEGDFVRKAMPDKVRDKESDHLLYQLDELKKRFNRGVVEAERKRRSLLGKILGNTVDTIQLSRAIMTSLDLSAVLRQGGILTFTHPISAAKSIVPMLKAFGSKEGEFRVMKEIRERPNYPLYKAAKLELTEEGSTLSKQEEQFMSRWAEKVPLVAGSQRAYTTFLNKIRADVFDTLVKSLGADGAVTKGEAQAIANYINIATGRGDLGKFAVAGTTLNTVFFAPRYVLSRFQFLTGNPLRKGFKESGRAKSVIAKEYAKYLTAIGTILGLSALAGASVETDPRSSDFGKIVIGDTRIDLMSGLSQVSTFLAREFFGESKSSTGKINRNRPDLRPLNLVRDPSDRLNRKTPLSYLEDRNNGAIIADRFWRTKFSPLFGAAYNTMQGKNVMGHKVTPLDTAQSLITPLSISYKDVYDNMRDFGVPSGTGLALLSILGAGINNYDDDRKYNR